MAFINEFANKIRGKQKKKKKVIEKKGFVQNHN